METPCRFSVIKYAIEITIEQYLQDGEQHLKNLNVMMNGEDFKGVAREIENNHIYG